MAQDEMPSMTKSVPNDSCWTFHSWATATFRRPVFNLSAKLFLKFQNEVIDLFTGLKSKLLITLGVSEKPK